MKKKIMAVILTGALCVAMSATALAAGNSSSTGSSSSSSSSSAPAAETPATMGNVNTNDVPVAIVNADGSVSKVNLTQYTERVDKTVVDVAAAAVAAGSTNPGEAVSAVMTTPASSIFKATIDALGGGIKMVNAGGYKVAATAAALDGSGRTVASVGTVKGVTKYAFIILTCVNEDGTVEVVEGTVDPVTLQVIGVFKGMPKAVTVSVIVPADKK